MFGGCYGDLIFEGSYWNIDYSSDGERCTTSRTQHPIFLLKIERPPGLGNEAVAQCPR